MTYRVSRSGSNYELQSEDNPYLHYIHNAPQSASVANIQQLTTLQSQNYYGNEDITTAPNAELHRFSQNADRFSTNPVSLNYIQRSKFIKTELKSVLENRMLDGR